MPPDNKEGRPGREAASEDQRPGDGATAIVSDASDVWTVVRDGWARAGDAMPRVGSLAWRALPADDPVRAAAAAVAELDACADLANHGPSVAHALAEVAG